MARRVWVVAGAVAAALAGGCGEGRMPVQSVYPVKGTILAGRAPLSAGRVTLTPVDKTQYGPAEATADVRPDGTFEPSAVGGQPGLMPGKWKVVVSPAGFRDGKPVRAKEAVPARYQRDETTDLVIDVAAGENAPTLVLK